MHMKKIMVVDNEQDFLFTIKDVFKSFSDEYELITAKSGIECLKLLKNNNIPNLILLDIMMPEMNGWEVARKLRQNLKWRNIPIIFISAIGDRTSKITSLELAEEFIEKPFNMKDLKIKIDEILEK
jgi:CheY-like chemotaxis protein